MTNSKWASVLVEDSVNSIKLTISRRPNRARFGIELALLLLRAVLIIPILGVVIVASAWQYLPPILAGAASVLGLGLLGLIFYRGFRETLENIYDRDIVEVDNQSVRIARSGGRFKDFAEYPAEKISRIALLFPDNPGMNWMRSLPGISGKMDVFAILRQRGFKPMGTFGKGIQYDEARQILELLWRRYPQYKG